MYTIEEIKNRILQGDALSVLKTLPSESIDCICTSPPYWALRDYKIEGIIWDENNFNCEHDFSLTTKPKVVWNVISSKTSLTGGKDKIRQSGGIMQSLFCQKCNAWKGQLGQEPTIDLHINHLIQIFNECKRILKKEGTCWVVMGDTYSGVKVGNTYGIWKDKVHPKTRRKNGMENHQNFKKDIRNEQIPEKSLCLIPERFSLKMIENKWILRNKIIWFKPNCMPSSAKDRFTVDYENIYFFTKSPKYYFKTQYEDRKVSIEADIKRINGQRLQKYKTKYTNERGYDKRIIKEWIPTNESINGRIKRCVWKISTKPFPEAHFAVFPPELVKQCLDAGCPIGGVTLDPFMGSGTVALVALKNAMNFVGIELNPDYIEMAMKRITPYLKQEKITQFTVK